MTIHKCFICGSSQLSATLRSNDVPLCEKHQKRVNGKKDNREYKEYSSTVHKSVRRGTIQSKRTFGVELECFSQNYSNSKDIAAELISPMHNLGSDGSVTGGESTELRTCPLAGMKGEDELQTICKILKALNFDTNTSCGTHVHIGIPEAKVRDTSDIVEGKLKNLYYFYTVFEPTLRVLLPADRRTNSYCWPLANLDSNHYARIQLDNITKLPAGIFKEKKRFDMFWLNQPDKESAVASKRNDHGPGRFALNFRSLYEHATLEIRYHEGTIDATRLIHWISLHAAIIDLVMDGAISEEEIAVYAKITDVRKLLSALLGLLEGRIAKSTYIYTMKRYYAYKHLNPANGYIQ